MAREIFLVVFPQRKVPAHWSMWIPNFDGAVKGKRIHAIGSPFHGYVLEIKSYDISKTARQYSKISLGSIHDDWVPELDSKAEGVATPGVSRTPLDPFAGENCQNWLISFVQALVNVNVLHHGVLEILAEAPKV